MFFSVSLYVALGICGIGLAYKVICWFRYRIGAESVGVSAWNRAGAAVIGIVATVFSGRILTLLKVFVLDVLFQWRVLKEDRLRWFMHMSLFWGFMLLLLMHALEDPITSRVFSGYQSTVNPFMFLRNLFGALVLVGMGIAVYRRCVVRGMRLTSGPMDVYAIVILAVIMISGVFLEATKIVSHTIFQNMAEEWGGLEEGEELAALRTYWSDSFGVVFPDSAVLADPSELEAGIEAHNNYCAECHSRPVSAFMSYGVARVIRPVAVGMTEAGVDVGLWYIHFLACFVGLAYLPFSKFFHIFASPVSLLANSVMDKDVTASPNVFTRRAMELDACTHCATCSIRCSVGVLFRRIPNETILPSEKLIAVKGMACGKELSRDELRKLQEGCFTCTSCYRCTGVCPAGINLQDLWLTIKDDLTRSGYPEPFVSTRESIAAECGPLLQSEAVLVPPVGEELQGELRTAFQAETFSACFECQTCTNVCPVVDNYDDPMGVLGLLPHQIMHTLGLGLREEALASRMIWDCLTCYNCQEHCPQGVQVADILYELKNMSARRVTRMEAGNPELRSAPGA